MATSLELAIAAIRSGRQEEGRQLLNLLIQQNPNNEMAWLWMSSVVSNDEQRARCLYHVLAINPGNAVARKGLEVLGIVVSDSRPVKVPRDSQPIQIPRPSPVQSGGQQRALPEPQQSGPAAAQPAQPERRPFRVDPQTVAEELPFTPITGANAPVRSTLAQTQRLPDPPGTGPLAQQPARPPDTGPLPGYAQPQLPPDTRPTSPQAVTPSPNPTPEIVGPAQPTYYQGPPAGHSNVTMGMPAGNYAPQPAPSIHSQATMGVPAYYQTQTGQLPEPMPMAHANTTMGMPLPGYLQPQQPLLHNQGMHASATMAMPTYPNMVDYRMAGPAAPTTGPKRKKRPAEEEDSDEEGINILAVIIFGSLSVTALGGLGMLILLMFTTG